MPCAAPSAPREEQQGQKPPVGTFWVLLGGRLFMPLIFHMDLRSGRAGLPSRRFLM